MTTFLCFLVLLDIGIGIYSRRGSMKMYHFTAKKLGELKGDLLTLEKKYRDQTEEIVTLREMIQKLQNKK